MPRARHRHHRLWRAVARPDQRSLAKEGAAARDFRADSPRFQARISTRNLALVEALRASRPRKAHASRRSPSPGSHAGHRNRAARRRTPPRPAGRGAGRAGREADGWILPRSKPRCRPMRPPARATPKRSLRTWIARSRPRVPDRRRGPLTSTTPRASRLSGLAAADRGHRGHEIAFARAGNTNLSRNGPIRLCWRKGDDGRPGLPLRRCRSRYDRLAFHREAEMPCFLECEVESALRAPICEASGPGDPQAVAGREGFD